jgi:hypothetical protein
MPICLNCCRGSKAKKAKQDENGDNNGKVSKGAGGDAKGAQNGNSGFPVVKGDERMPYPEEEGGDDEPVYAVVDKDKQDGKMVSPGRKIGAKPIFRGIFFARDCKCHSSHPATRIEAD